MSIQNEMRHDERARPLPKLFLFLPQHACARALCSRETLIPAGPFRINIGYRVSLRLLAETSVAAVRGLGKECTLGRKLHLSLRREDGSSTGFRLLRTLFSSQLCQLLTTRPLSRTETNITKKRISEAFQQTYRSNDLAATSTVAIVRNRVGRVG